LVMISWQCSGRREIAVARTVAYDRFEPLQNHSF
jgi:hypothetical protein